MKGLLVVTNPRRITICTNSAVLLNSMDRFSIFPLIVLVLVLVHSRSFHQWWTRSDRPTARCLPSSKQVAGEHRRAFSKLNSDCDFQIVVNVFPVLVLASLSNTVESQERWMTCSEGCKGHVWLVGCFLLAVSSTAEETAPPGGTAEEWEAGQRWGWAQIQVQEL